MFNLRRWNNILNKIVIPNGVIQQHFSALTKCHSGNCFLLNQTPIYFDRIPPSNRRDFIGWVGDKKDGYRTQKDQSDREHIKFGLKQLKTEIKLWTEEVKEKFRADPMLLCPSGMFRIYSFQFFFE